MLWICFLIQATISSLTNRQTDKHSTNSACICNLQIRNNEVISEWKGNIEKNLSIDFPAELVWWGFSVFIKYLFTRVYRVNESLMFDMVGVLYSFTPPLTLISIFIFVWCKVVSHMLVVFEPTPVGFQSIRAQEKILLCQHVQRWK